MTPESRRSVELRSAHAPRGYRGDMLALGKIDLDDLARLLDERNYGAGYLNPATGEIRQVFADEFDDYEEEEEEEERLGDWLTLGGENGHNVFRDMEIFTDAVGDRRTRRLLTEALAGPRPVRAFRHHVHTVPEMLGTITDGDVQATADELTEYLG